MSKSVFKKRKNPIKKKKSGYAIVEAKSLWKSFETGDHFTTILKDVSVDIEKGEFVILFGPSGCGKTTFLNTVMGLEHPDKGEIIFNGEKIWDLNTDERAVIRKRNIGIVHQQQNWIKSLDVLGNVTLIGKLLGYSKEEAEKIAKEKLKLVGMTHREDYKPYELSSGEQQRISLARSLMSKPVLMIADEPTGNLDVKAGINVMNIFKDIAKEGNTILMVTHNLESLEFADRIIFMLDGKIRKDIQVEDEDIVEVKRKIVEDIEAFIDEAQTGKDIETKNAPKPEEYHDEIIDEKKKFMQILDFIKFNIIFTFSMFLLLFLFVPSYLFEKVFFKKHTLSWKVEKLIMNMFNKLEKNGSKEKSISSWDLGEISLRHLMLKKSRTIITVFGVGLGVGFITFLLSIGYGLERLVVNEMAEIEQMRQVVVQPIVGSEIVLNEERFNLIQDVEGVEEVYPLKNIATTLMFGDSQTDIVAHGVGQEYLVVSRSSFLNGNNFDEREAEIVLGEQVLPVLGVDHREIVGQVLTVAFVPVGEERKGLEEDDFVGGARDNQFEYVVSGVVADSSSPLIYFPINDANRFGMNHYSEALLVLSNDVDMKETRASIENMGMKTSSVMDTVSQVETLFRNFRLALGTIGIVAFIISILGMINTLTVSLMERTREVGLLKSIGMKSTEVRKLFVTESMIISFWGGIAGITLGMFLGLILSGVLSYLSVSRGGDYLWVSSVPFYIIIGIVLLSVLVGFLTGLYPSRRAVRMSPLDALRYE